MTRTIYVSTSDFEVWIRARNFCTKHKVSISKLIVHALTFYLDRLEV